MAKKEKTKLTTGDKVVYVRQQKGHSAVLAICLGWVTLYILPIYWLCSKNHYYHI